MLSNETYRNRYLSALERFELRDGLDVKGDFWVHVEKLKAELQSKKQQAVIDELTARVKELED